MENLKPWQDEFLPAFLTGKYTAAGIVSALGVDLGIHETHVNTELKALDDAGEIVHEPTHPAVGKPAIALKRFKPNWGLGLGE